MNFLLKAFNSFYTPYVKRIEKRIGYSVRYKKIPNAWIDGLVCFNMEPSWRQHGILAEGVNYWTLGALTSKNISSNFSRNEKQYQSWLGAYLVKFKEDKEFTIQDHFNLAVADQKNWLADFGDREPYIEMLAENVTKTELISSSGYNGTLYSFGCGPSHSALGNNMSNLYNRILMSLAAARYNDYNPKLKLNKDNLIPKEFETNYETVILKGYVAIIELEKNIKVVLYGNGSALLDSEGREVKDNFPLLKDDILEAFNSVVINKI